MVLLQKMGGLWSGLKEEGTIPSRAQLRLRKYLNNLIEQDHRFIRAVFNRVYGGANWCSWQRKCQ
jgi:transposase-like protein